MRILLTLVATSILCACATGTGHTAAPPAAPRQAWVVGADGRPVGQVTFTQGPGGVLIHLEFSEHALPPGWHGMHIHEHGDCSDFAQGFHASGGHVGMGAHVQHGLLNPNGPEAGDLPNLFATASGAFGAEVFDPHVTFTAQSNDDERMPLLDADGSALIIHAAPDDQHSQPIGNAGARIACAALTPLP